MHMKKNGFTLIELLGVIILIALISFIAFPTILNNIKNSKTSIEDSKEKLILNAAELYIEDNEYYYIENIEGSYCIDMNTLIQSNHLDSDIAEDYSTKYVEVTYDGKFNYEIVDDLTSTCTLLTIISN